MVFKVKNGMANEMVEEMKQMAQSGGMLGARSGRILTDLSGPFNTVVQEVVTESIDEFLKAMAAMFAQPEMRESMADQPDNMLDGSKEYYTIEYEW